MPNKIIFSSLLAQFGVPLEAYPSKQGQYVHGEWVPAADIISESNKVQVNEPFIPYGLMSKYGQSVNFQSSGRMSESDMQWFSGLDIPVGSFVIHNGTKYEIIDCNSWQDYSDVNIYGCKAVSAFE